MGIIYAAVHHRNNHVGAAGGVVLPYRKHVHVAPLLYGSLSAEPIVVIVPLLLEAGVVEQLRGGAGAMGRMRCSLLRGKGGVGCRGGVPPADVLPCMAVEAGAVFYFRNPLERFEVAASLG